MRINELKAILATIEQDIKTGSMAYQMGKLGRYAMFKNCSTGLGYDLGLSLESLDVTKFLAKDDQYKTKKDIHFLTAKQYFIVCEWLSNLVF